MRKNVSSQFVAFQAVSTTDGSAVTTGTPAVYYTIDGGTEGTGSGACVHEGHGTWSYACAQAETNGNHVVFTFVLSGAVSQTVNVYPVGYDETAANVPSDVIAISGDTTAANNAESFFDGTGYAGTNNVIPTVTTLTGHTAQTGDCYARLGAPAGASHAADVAAVKSDTAAVKAKTDNLPTDPADQSAVEAAITAATSTLATAANLATVAGYLDTEIAAILADTDELQKAITDGGRTDNLIDAIKAKTDAMLAAADIRTAVGLAAANLDTQIATLATAANLATLDTLVDRMAPLLVGTVTGAGTGTEVYAYGGVTATVTVDVDGNVSGVVFS